MGPSPVIATDGAPGAPPASIPYAWPIAMLLTVCFTMSYVDRQIISLLVGPIKESLGLTDTQMGLMQGVSFSLFYVAATLPLARLADRGSRPRIMGACIAVWSLATMLCGLASNFWQMLLARIGVAAGEAGLPPSALTTMADMFDPKRLARATSIFMLAPFVGGGIALLGGGALYGWAETVAMPTLPGIGTLERWQFVFMVVGAPGLLLGAMVFVLADPKPNRAPPSGKDGTRELIAFILGEWRICLLYMIGTSLVVTLFNAHISWMPASIIRSQGIDEKTIGTLFGPIYLIAGSAGTLIAGAIIGRAPNDLAGRTIRFMRLGCLFLLPMAVAAPLMPTLTLQLICIGASIFLTSSIVGLAALPFQFLAPTHLRAQSVALMGLVSALLGTGLGPLLVGLFSDHVFAGAAQPLASALATVAGIVMPLAIILLSLVSRNHNRRRLDLLNAPRP